MQNINWLSLYTVTSINILIWNPCTVNTGNKLCIACRSKIL